MPTIAGDQDSSEPGMASFDLYVSRTLPANPAVVSITS
jgi:hypothetical protein